MKKISLFALAFAAGIAVNAQDPQLRKPMEVKPRFGIKAGVNSARLEIDNDRNEASGLKTTSKTSLHAGVFYNLPVSDKFRIQPELLYSIQGSKTSAMSSTDPNLAGINEYDFHYVSLPVMLQYMTPGGFSVEVGPQVSYLSSANADRSNGTEVNLKDMDYIKKVDFSAAGGIGYLTPIGLGINARYVHGFTNVFNNEDRPASTSGWNYQNRNLQFSLVYHFGATK
jgi:hypothetical protein